MEAGPDDDRWSASARAAYTFVPYGRFQQGTKMAENQNHLEIDVHLGTLQLQAAAPTGTALDLQLPFGSLTTRSIVVRRTDAGLGDLELRVRQSAGRWVRWPQLALALGAVLPTGPYAARSDDTKGADYLTLGRGTAWWVAEIDARITMHRRASVFGQVSARGPLAHTSDGFAWGTEVRFAPGARGVAIPGRLAFVVTSDLQWRDRASQPVSGERVATVSSGSWQWTASPAAVVELGAGVSASVGARIPLWSYVYGNQLVPQIGGFAAISYAHRLEPRRAAVRYEPLPGGITVVDYWATWCEPCVEISRRLAEAAKRWPDVRIVSVDATRWPDDDAPPLPRGARGLPVIELLDETGARLALLVGPDALQVIERVDALRAGRTLAPREAP